MHKVIIFILLLTILGASGYTFYSMYEEQVLQRQSNIESETSADNSWIILNDKLSVFYVRPNVRVIYENSNFAWFHLNDTADSCPYIINLNKRTGSYTTTDINSCGVFSLHTEPFFIEIQREGTLDYYVKKFITAYNFDSGERINIFNVEEQLGQNETLISSCKNEGYDQPEQVCYASYRTRNQELILGVFRTNPTPLDQTQPLEFKNEKIREIIIDLSQFY